MMCITQMLPTGDIQTPNTALQVKWLYMSFHRNDRAEYLRSGCKLCAKTLLTLVEYFESNFDVQVSYGLLQKKHNKQVLKIACQKYRHELHDCYHDKLNRLADGQRHQHSWRHNRNNTNQGGK